MKLDLQTLRALLPPGSGKQIDGAIIITVTSDMSIDIYDNVAEDIPPDDKKDLLYKVFEHAKQISTGYPAQCCGENHCDDDDGSSIDGLSISGPGLAIQADPEEVDATRAGIAAIMATPPHGIIKYIAVAAVPDPSQPGTGTLLVRTDCTRNELILLGNTIATAAPGLVPAIIPDDISGLDP